MTTKRLTIAAAAVCILAWMWLRSQTIDTPDGRVRLERDTAKRDAWRAYYDGLAGEPPS